MPKIHLLVPTGVAGIHHPAAVELEIGVDIDHTDARYLLGIGKARHADSEPTPGEIRNADPAPENGDPAPAKGGKK